MIPVTRGWQSQWRCRNSRIRCSLPDALAAYEAERLAPAIAPAVLAIGGGSYGVLYTVAGFFAVLGAFAILPVNKGQVSTVSEAAHRRDGPPVAGESEFDVRPRRRRGSSRTVGRGRRAPRAGSP